MREQDLWVMVCEELLMVRSVIRPWGGVLRTDKVMGSAREGVLVLGGIEKSSGASMSTRNTKP